MIQAAIAENTWTELMSSTSKVGGYSAAEFRMALWFCFVCILKDENAIHLSCWLAGSTASCHRSANSFAAYLSMLVDRVGFSLSFRSCLEFFVGKLHDRTLLIFVSDVCGAHVLSQCWNRSLLLWLCASLCSGGSPFSFSSRPHDKTSSSLTLHTPSIWIYETTSALQMRDYSQRTLSISLRRSTRIQALSRSRLIHEEPVPDEQHKTLGRSNSLRGPTAS